VDCVFSASSAPQTQKNAQNTGVSRHLAKTERTEPHVNASSIDTLIGTYTPNAPATHWAPVAEFVRDAIRATTLDDAEQVRRALIFTTQFVIWAVRVAGMPLTRDGIFDTALIEEHMATRTGLSQTSQVRQRSLLLRIAHDLVSAPAPASTTSRTSAQQPYTRAELAHFAAWATSQPSERQRNNALAVLTLGVGCGLTPDEVRNAHADHIKPAGLGLHVPGRVPRFVPVLDGWEEYFRAVRDANPAAYLFRTNGARDQHTLKVFIRDTQGMGPKPRPSRLRATWIHAQLRAGVPLNVLLPAAGLTSTTSLQHYLAYLPDPADSDAVLTSAKAGA